MERRIYEDWPNTQLSENFCLKEFVVSESHPHLALMIVPTIEQANNLHILCQMGLQPIREEYGFVSITSGLRDAALNKAVGGASDSQHLYGEAADFICSTLKPESMLDVFTFCVHNLNWQGEVFLYKKRGHLHISLPNLFVKPDHAILDK